MRRKVGFTLAMLVILVGSAIGINAQADAQPIVEKSTVCEVGEYEFNGVCLLETSGDTFFVALDGDDDNPGTYDEPFGTWQKPFDVVGAGDVVYYRGGVYMVPADNRGGYQFRGVSGTATDRIYFMNYPGETPILDFDNVLEGSPYATKTFSGLKIRDASYLTFSGLTLRNLWQKDGEDEIEGLFWVEDSYDVIIERCVVYNSGGAGFTSSRSDEVYFINDDAYNCVDKLTTIPPENPMPGNDGTGFLDYNRVDPNKRVYYKNCRAWNNGDQGFSSGSIAYAEYDGCWSMNNGFIEGGGHGFKMGWVPTITEGVLNRVYKNNLAADNRQRGWDSNDQGFGSGEMMVLNNFAYNTGYPDDGWVGPSHGFYVFETLDSDARELLRSYTNNTAYHNEDGEIGVSSEASYTHKTNSWDSPVTLSDGDFINLDTTQLYRPRKADGSLPDITFGHLAEGSDLIDAGTVVSGYHCLTSGAHPDEDCVEWYGEAPDLGTFESNYSEFNSSLYIPTIIKKGP